jgi:G3E family GTPase
MKQLYLITGFLGAGKTTLLKELVPHFPNQKVAVIVNEFGETGVDDLVLEQDGIHCEAIVNGSIFCVCRKDLFLDALSMAYRKESEVVIVETSGLSDPMGTDEILSSVDRIYGAHYELRGIICLIDAVNFHKVINTAVCVEGQIKAADLFVINKCDLVSDTAEIERLLTERNPEAEIIRTAYGKLDSSVFVRLHHVEKDKNGGKRDLVTQKKQIDLPELVSHERLVSWLDEFRMKTYRMKGFVRTERGAFHAEYVMGEGELAPIPPFDGKAFLVLLYDSRKLDYKMLQQFDLF